jgi:YHS domain-containing protein
MATAIDPVCGMEVDTDSDFKSMYKGKHYYFCSAEDKKSFDKNPAKYLNKQPAGSGTGSQW